MTFEFPYFLLPLHHLLPISSSNTPPLSPSPCVRSTSKFWRLALPVVSPIKLFLCVIVVWSPIWTKARISYMSFLCLSLWSISRGSALSCISNNANIGRVRSLLFCFQDPLDFPQPWASVSSSLPQHTNPAWTNLATSLASSQYRFPYSVF